ncbi:hypothetical protein ABPG72_006590 [Tetrahymena utriculariae]
MQHSQSCNSFETLSQQFKSYIINGRKPTIKEIKEISKQFFDKIRFCSIQYDLNNLNKNQKEKQEQQSYILELKQFLEECKADPQQQEILFLPNILYAYIVPCRKMIRKTITYYLNSQIHQYCEIAGIPWLLQFLYGVFSAFSTPLREEHIKLFKKVIILLHKVQTYHLFYKELRRICDLFIEKDSSLKYPLLQSIFRYWPYHNTQKQLLFFKLILYLIEICECQSIYSIIPKLFYRLVQCLTGSNLQVADHVLCFFENEIFLKVLIYYKAYTYPLLTYQICQLASNRWHPILKESFIVLKTIIKDLNTRSFKEALDQKSEPFQAVINGNIKLIYMNEEKWKILFAQAKQKDPSICEPVIPYLDTHSITEYNCLNKEYICEYE